MGRSGAGGGERPDVVNLEPWFGSIHEATQGLAGIIVTFSVPEIDRLVNKPRGAIGERARLSRI